MELTKNANLNYVASIVKIEKLRPHSNADRLNIATIDFQDVIVGLDIKLGDIGVYFPVESQINYKLISALNGFRDKTKNKNQNVSGFFEESCRVKAIRLRGEKSCGWFVLWEDFAKALSIDEQPIVGTQFDKVRDTVIVRKYTVHEPSKNKKDDIKEKSILIDNQVRFHVDTENLRKNINKIRPDDTISVTYKYHGTSWWVGNLLTKRPLSWIEKILKFFGIKLIDTQYSHLYGSRRVVKNGNSGGYYKSDLWRSIYHRVGTLPEGYTLYGEAVGYTESGEPIQKNYDYGCTKNEYDIYVYRITHITPSGHVIELSWPQIKEFCERYGFRTPEEYFYGKAWDHFLSLIDDYQKINKKSFINKKVKDLDVNDFYENYIPLLEYFYTEKSCHICKNNVPAEGIVLRVEDLFECLPYKLKSFSFLEQETKALDRGEVGIDDRS
jgi:tRNA-binding EMAP/Myf-like protein